MISPTSKNTGIATMNPVRPSASGARSSPNFSISVNATRCAPPDTWMIWPIITPRPTTIATNPSVSPMPAVIVGTMSASGMPAINATTKLVNSNATNACSLSQMTSTRSSATPPAVASSSAVTDIYGLRSSAVMSRSSGSTAAIRSA